MRQNRSQLGRGTFEVVETAPNSLTIFSEEKLADLDGHAMTCSKDATEYINKLLKSNPAFEIFSSWVKDGLLAVGVCIWLMKPDQATSNVQDASRRSRCFSKVGLLS